MAFDPAASDPARTSGQQPAQAASRRSLWLRSAIVMVGVVVLLVIVEAIDVATNSSLESNGIRPRQLGGLDGIVWAPMLHSDWSHLFANLAPGVVLGFLLLLARRFLLVTAIVWLVSGVAVWLFSASYSVTIGASGIVFGWLAYLLVRGLFNRDPWQILIGVVLFAVYGSILWGVLPTNPMVSWQAHLFGAIGGVLAAWFLADRDRRAAKKSPPAVIS